MRRELIVFALVGLLTFPCAAGTTPESDRPIRIIVNNWSSQVVMSHILGGIYRKMGYTVEYSTKDIADQWGGLHRGTEHVQVEVWEGTMQEAFHRISAYGKMVDAGTHEALTREEWWYPAYVEEVCPGLPDWRALKRCASLFATDRTAPKGRYLAGPWEKPEKARIRALGLDFVVEEAKNSDELWIELEKAWRRRQPIVLFNWTPNWVEVRYEGGFIEFPPHAPACETDPSWGINKDWTHDCGNPPAGWLKKAAWHRMKEIWPCAWQVLRNMSFTNFMIGSLAALVDREGLNHEEAAHRWLAENTVVWSSWLPGECRSSRQASDRP